MKKSLLVRVVALVMAFLMLAGCASTPDSTQPPTVPPTNPPTEPPTDPPLTDEQLNAVALHNYLAVLTQELTTSPNGILYLEEVFNILTNNFVLSTVDERTQVQLNDILESIKALRREEALRERIQFLYEQEKAELIRDSLKDTAGLALVSGAGAVATGNVPAALSAVVSSLATNAVGTYSGYNSVIEELSEEYDQAEWEIIQSKIEIVWDSKQDAFNYSLDLSQEENIPDGFLLSQEEIKDFAEYRNKTNSQQRLTFYKNHEDVYQNFSYYWLERAVAHYELRQFEECLESMARYEAVRREICKKDKELAQTLPLIISAAYEVYDSNQYITEAEHYLKLLIDNTGESDWSLRYFAAQMYADLYRRTNDKDYLTVAIGFLENNINQLVEYQRVMNVEYITGKKLTDEDHGTELDLIAGFIEFWNGFTKTDLPPVYEPLAMNLDLLFGLANILELSEERKLELERMLRGEGDPLFLSETLENKYSFVENNLELSAELHIDRIILPVVYVSEKTQIKVTVTNNGVTTTYEDWVVGSVERPGEDFATFKVTYTSEGIKSQVWSAEAKVQVDVIVDSANPNDIITLYFEVGDYFDYLLGKNITFVQVAE